MRNFFFWIGIVLVFIMAFLLKKNVFAVAPRNVLIEVFIRQDCIHCRNEKTFLSALQQKESDIRVLYYDIADSASKKIWEAFLRREKLPLVTPVTAIGSSIIQGFDSSETTGTSIYEAVKKARGKKTVTVQQYLENSLDTRFTQTAAGATCTGDAICPVEDASAFTFRIPFTSWTINARSFSLPTLSLVLGTIDGFNPCAMWVLVTFLVVLAQVGNRRKMWQFAGTFIVAETIMYYFILTVWYSAWDFVGLDRVVTPLVGMLAVGSGVFFLNEFRREQAACKVTNPTQRARMINRIHSLTQSKFTAFTFVGIILLAFSVNVIEFACSIGIPQAFTKILELNSLNFFIRQFYMFIYILGYMLDDFVVFGIALYSFEKIGLTHKYIRWSHLAGGILMLLLGFLLMVRPSWLHFT